MKKYIALFLFLLSSNLYGQQKWHLGLKGAFEMRGAPSSFGSFGDIQGSGSVPSYGIGLFAKRHIWRRFSIMAEPAFHDIGSCNFKEQYSPLDKSQLIFSNYNHIRYSAILLPIGINYKVGLKTAIEVGVTPTFLIRGKQTQTIYNFLTKGDPNSVKKDILEDFYQSRINFPFFLGISYELSKKVELGIRINGGSYYYFKIIRDGGNALPEYVRSLHNTGLAFGVRYRLNKISLRNGN